jgi:hypothetical protein
MFTVIQKLTDKQKAALYLLMSNNVDDVEFIKKNTMTDYARTKFESNQCNIETIFKKMQDLEQQAREYEEKYRVANAYTSVYVDMISENLELENIAFYSSKYNEAGNNEENKPKA